ncbi:zinc transporter 7-like [Paramacrobiotus metropolitanus]|uniref:zinc transporter 7-like n=1 Tax=Paramacrobiotus metropolitanus TaxID=2943436 RepID=UPI0024456176|nr:zinc transporter 7-like [Paramacrobiotus metropolitanus]
MVSLLKALCSGVGSCILFFYFIISLTFAFIELSYGILTNSLSLISDSFHMFFDCTGLFIGICAAAIIRAQWRPNIQYTYGYGRVDTIAGLVNAVCLLFVGFLLSFEAFKRIQAVPVVKSDGLLYISVAGLCVNFLGIIIVYSNTPQRRLRRHSLSPQATYDLRQQNIRNTTSFYDVNDQSRGL